MTKPPAQHEAQCPICNQLVAVKSGRLVTHGPGAHGAFTCRGSREAVRADREAMPAPTPAQLTAMQQIAAGNVRVRNSNGSAPRIDGASPTVVGRLVRTLAWACWPVSGLHDGEACELTDTGRKVLARATAAASA